MTKKERALLQHAMQVLGPRATCQCAGCNWEINAALTALRAVGIRYKGRKRRGPKHDRAAERAGNELVAVIPVTRRDGRLEVDEARKVRVVRQ